MLILFSDDYWKTCNYRSPEIDKNNDQLVFLIEH